MQLKRTATSKALLGFEEIEKDGAAVFFSWLDKRGGIRYNRGVSEVKYADFENGFCPRFTM